MNLAYGQGGLKLEISILRQHILAKSKGGLINEGGVMSSEYGILNKTKTFTSSKLFCFLNTISGKILRLLFVKRLEVGRIVQSG